MTLAEQIELVCLMEATARKPGNVHPAAAFSDLRYDDFVRAAKAIAKPLAAVREVGLGRAIFNAVKATRAATGTNVNLGIVFLLAPLAAVPDGVPLEQGIRHVLSGTTVEDAEQVYAAIRLAQPGGMGETSSQDVRERPTVTLRDAMAFAADRDRIAEQYITDFDLVFKARAKLEELPVFLEHWETAIVTLHVWMISNWTDTLIGRKCGKEIAEQASVRAGELIDSVRMDGHFMPEQVVDFDNWLRADGHRRNPGTTADLIAATLFASLRDNWIEMPTREEICRFAARLRRNSIKRNKNQRPDGKSTSR